MSACSLQIVTAAEPFSMTVIAKNQGISTLQKAKGICVGIALLPGNYDTVVSRSPDLAEIPTTSRLGFSDSYTPDLQRQVRV